MNIGITCYPTYGGSGIVATELGLELATRGHEVHFITYANPDPPGSRACRASTTTKSRSPTIRCSNTRRTAWRWPRAWRRWRRATSSTCCTCITPFRIRSRPCWRSRCSRRARRLPFITTLHGTDITLVGVDRSYFPITKFSIEKSDGITSISEYLRQQTVEVFGVPNEIRVINNFVNCDLYHPDEQKTRAATYAPDGREAADSPLEFPPGEARAGLHPHSGRGPQDARRRTC